ncbi:MAG: ABC transporter substrate-binding protein [Propionibacteriales bacterium]|nr:ABC transporter substrate-binding protein [Propionibacteriales bacterium]
MRIRMLPVTTAAAMALLATSCASGGEGSSDGGSGALAGEGSGDSCVIEDPVPVGAALSLTGAAASYGESQQKGLEVAIDKIAETEGVSYDLTVEDDATDPKQGITVFEQFISQDQVSVILGPTLSNAAKTTDPIAQEESVPVLGISNTAEGITEIGDYVFRNSLTEAAVIPQTIAKAKETLGLEKVVVMYSNDDAFTESGFKAFESALESEGVEITKTLTFSKADTDFRTLLTDAKAEQPDAVVVSGLIEAAIPLVTQARQLGIDAPIIGGNGFNSPQLMVDAGEAAEGVVVGAAWNSASEGPENAEFLEAFKAKHGSDPDQFAAQAYTGLILVDQAVRAGCSGEREDIKEQLGKLKDVPTALGTFSIDENRDADHAAVVQIVEGGKFTVLD